MASQKSSSMSQRSSTLSQRGKSKEGINFLEKWKFHDSLDDGVSFARVITRSQTAFQRIENSESDAQFFSTPDYYKPGQRPHIMEIMKGPHGSIPRTVITRSKASYLKPSEHLCETIKEYKELREKAQDVSEKAQLLAVKAKQIAEKAKKDEAEAKEDAEKAEKAKSNEEKLKAEADAKKMEGDKRRHLSMHYRIL